MGRIGHFYMELGLLNSGKVSAKNYNFICSSRAENRVNRVSYKDIGNNVNIGIKCFTT